MKKLISIALASIMAIGLLSACSGAKQSDASTAPEATQESNAEAETPSQSAETPTELTKLRVAVQPFYISSPLGYVMEQGWDKEAGLDIELVMFPSGAPMNEALAAGLWDVSTIGGAFVFGVVNYDAKVIGSHINGTGGNEIYIRADSDIATVKASNPTFPEVYGNAETVIGKTILQTTGTTSQLAIIKWLEAIGVKESDVSMVHLEFPQAYQAFKIGEGDVAALVSPYCLQAAGEGYFKAADLSSLGINLYEEIVASKDAYEKMPEELTTFLKLIYRANDALESDFEAKVQTVKKWYNDNGNDVDEDTVRQECSLKPFITSQEALAMEMGVYEKDYAEFMILTEKLTADQLSIVENNVKGELLKAALS